MSSSPSSGESANRFLVWVSVILGLLVLYAGFSVWNNLYKSAERSEALQGVSGVAGFAATVVLLVMTWQANRRADQAQQDTRAALEAAQAQAEAMKRLARETARLNEAELLPHVALILNIKREICVVNLSRNLALVKSLVLSSPDGSFRETLNVVDHSANSAFYNTVTTTGGVVGPSEVLRYAFAPPEPQGSLQVRVTYLYGPTGTTEHQAVFALKKETGLWMVG